MALRRVLSGYVGQLIYASGTRTFSGTNATNAWLSANTSTGSGLTLTAGIWIVGYGVELSITSGTLTCGAVILSTDSTDGAPSNNASAAQTNAIAFLGNLEPFSVAGANKQGYGFINTASTVTYNTKALTTCSSFTGSYTSRFWAVRIA